MTINRYLSIRQFTQMRASGLFLCKHPDHFHIAVCKVLAHPRYHYTRPTPRGGMDESDAPLFIFRNDAHMPHYTRFGIAAGKQDQVAPPAIGERYGFTGVRKIGGCTWYRNGEMREHVINKTRAIKSLILSGGTIFVRNAYQCFGEINQVIGINLPGIDGTCGDFFSEYHF